MLPAKTAAKVYRDMVEDPVVPLYYVRKYGPYRRAMFETALSLPRFPSVQTVKNWLSLKSTFELFKKNTAEAKGSYFEDWLRGNSTGVKSEAKGLYFEDWLSYVSGNERVVNEILDWCRTGVFEDRSTFGIDYVTPFLVAVEW